MVQEQVRIPGKVAVTSRMILLVEDDADNAQVIADLIAQETVHRVLVADSLGALKVARIVRPDLFILDYLLPETNGIVLYDQLHANRELEVIPAIIISAAFDTCKDEIERRNLRGLSKPFNLGDLLALIEEAFA
jgi:DNA-binding response OmpR family regulator